MKEKATAPEQKTERFEVKSGDWDFKAPANFRGWEDQIKGLFGNESYVGTDHCVLLVEYSPKLVQLLRPFPDPNVVEKVNFKLYDDVLSERAKSGKWVVKSTTRKLVLE